MFIQKKKKKNDIISFLFLLCAIITCMLFSGGLNWQHCITSNILCLTYLIINRNNVKFDRTSLFFGIILLSGIIALCLTSGDKQYGIHEYEKFTCLIFAYSAGTATDKNDISKAIGIVGLILAVVGLSAYCNLINPDEFIFNDRKILRLQSFIKYANTTAVILGVSYLSIIDLYKQTNNKYLLYASGCIITAFFLTLSKASILVFSFIALLLIITNKDISKEMITQTIISLFTAALAVILVKNRYNSIAFLIIISGIIFSAKIKINLKPIIIVFFSTVCICFYLIYNFDIFSTLFKRFTYTQDAVKLLKNHWIFGIGPGEWNYYQYSVQSADYTVKYIHNGWLQIWLEYGMTAFLSFAFIYAKSIYCLVKAKNYFMFGSLLAIVVHALVDIDFSFGIILITVGLIMGSNTSQSRKSNKIDISTGIFILSVCSIILTYMCAEVYLRGKFEKAYLQNNYNQALNYAQKTEILCPYDSNLKLSIAALSGKVEEKDLENAIKSSPLDKDIYKTYINYLIDNGNKVNIKTLTENYINLAPKQEETYINVQSMLEKALKNKLCTKSEYQIMASDTERRRNQEAVIDRNELLNKLTY